MRKLLIAGLAIASLTGIAHAQAERQGAPDIDFKALRQLAMDANNISTTCVDAAGVTRNLDETTSIGKVQFRCVQTFGDGLKSKGAGWIIVSPAGMRVNLF